MSETKGKLMTTVDFVLMGNEIKNQPRTYLLLKLCQLSLILWPDKAEYYWRQLAPLKNDASKDLQTELGSLGSVMESTSKSGAKGFAAEVIADIDVAKNLLVSNADEARRRLYDCEERLKKRRWPTGKTPAWIALVETWARIDRQHALQLINEIPSNVQESLIQRLNRTKLLTAEEWTILANKVGMKHAVEIAVKILGDENVQLRIPKKVLFEVEGWIRNSMRQITTSQGETELAKLFAQWSKLVIFHIGCEQSDVIQVLLEKMYFFLAETRSLDQIWPTRFNLLSKVLELGASSKLMTNEMFERLLKKTPSYLTNFLRAHYAAVTVSPNEIEDVCTDLMSKTRQDPDTEAWFFVSLVVRGLGKEAMGLAEKSANASTLLSRLRRAWLSTHPESAKSVISSTDMAGDPIGEFFAQGTVQDRVTHLRNVTEDGKRSVPRAMWHAPDFVEIAKGHVPLYSSYRGNTKKNEQFKEQLRISGYGEYKYQDVDNALLGTLVMWSNEDATEVRSLLRAMWIAIQPSDQILMLNWLRAAILTRCQNVFAADCDVLIHDFLGWFKRKMVYTSLSFQVGDKMFTLKYPVTVLLQFCVGSAMAVNTLSPTHRDQILLAGLKSFKGNSLLVEAAAQLYNTGKKVLDLTPPPGLDPTLVEAWQLGIVKNAIPFIAQAMIAQSRV